MILLFLSAILVVFCGMVFSLSFSVQGLNRAIINTPIELIYRTAEYRNGSIYFNKNELESDLNSYYENTLSRYVSNYDVDYYFYNIDDGSMCYGSYCEAVEITVECKLMSTYDYKRVMYYEVKGNGNG